MRDQVYVPNLRRVAPYEFRDRPLSSSARQVQKRDAEMRIFGAKRISKTSAFRTTNVATRASAVAHAAVMRAREAEGVEEAPISRSRSRPTRCRSSSRRVPARGLDASDEAEGDSDVFVVRRSSPDSERRGARRRRRRCRRRDALRLRLGERRSRARSRGRSRASARPSIAVRTMRNAVEWCIVSGSEWASVDAARAKGACSSSRTPSFAAFQSRCTEIRRSRWHARDSASLAVDRTRSSPPFDAGPSRETRRDSRSRTTARPWPPPMHALPTA